MAPWHHGGVPGEWMIEDRVADAAELHAGWPAAERRPDLPRVAVCRVTAPAVVLGSTQPELVIDRQRVGAAGFAVARRRSGGGAVLVTPDDPVWIDVWLPASHRLWRSDVGRAFDWLGEAWVDALAASGVTGLSAHRQGYESCTRWSSLVCFGGIGTGEVVAADGRKVVGLAQRRTRHGSWFQGACVLRWEPVPLVDVLVMTAEERQAAAAGLGQAVVGVTELCESTGSTPVDRAGIVTAFIDALP
jgi:lipoate---protein ligase